MKYRKKPIVVEAIKFTGVNFKEITTFTHRASVVPDHGNAHLYLDTVDGNRVLVPVGAYVVVDAKGYPYPCDAEIFEQNHDEVAGGSWDEVPGYTQEEIDRVAALAGVPKLLGEVEYQGTRDFVEGDVDVDGEAFIGDLEDLTNTHVLGLDLTPQTWLSLGSPRRVKVLVQIVEEAGFGGAREVSSS